MSNLKWENVQFAKFESASQIPKEFIRKELELKGKVR